MVVIVFTAAITHQHAFALIDWQAGGIVYAGISSGCLFAMCGAVWAAVGAQQ